MQTELSSVIANIQRVEQWTDELQARLNTRRTAREVARQIPHLAGPLSAELLVCGLKGRWLEWNSPTRQTHLHRSAHEASSAGCSLLSHCQNSPQKCCPHQRPVVLGYVSQYLHIWHDSSNLSGLCGIPTFYCKCSTFFLTYICVPTRDFSWYVQLNQLQCIYLFISYSIY